MTMRCPLIQGERVGTGLGRGHWSRQHCEGSRPEADKLLIKPRQVGQAGAGNPRDRSNERHARRTASILESHPALPTPAWSINPTGSPTTLTAVLGSDQPRRGGPPEGGLLLQGADL